MKRNGSNKDTFLGWFLLSAGCMSDGYLHTKHIWGINHSPSYSCIYFLWIYLKHLRREAQDAVLVLIEVLLWGESSTTIKRTSEIGFHWISQWPCSEGLSTATTILLDHCQLSECFQFLGKCSQVSLSQGQPGNFYAPPKTFNCQNQIAGIH